MLPSWGLTDEIAVGADVTVLLYPYGPRGW
jgi:hypothetical protein